MLIFLFFFSFYFYKHSLFYTAFLVTQGTQCRSKMEMLCAFSTGPSFLSKYPCTKAFTSFPSWGAQAGLSWMICLPQRNGMQSVNERPEHPAGLFSLPLESLLSRLASWQPNSKQKCCWLAGLCVLSAWASVTAKSWGLYNLPRSQAALSEIASGKFCLKKSSPPVCSPLGI